MTVPGRNWVDWHRAYDDAESSLTRRLLVVRRRIGEVLDAAGTGPIRILGLCAGDGRDVLPELIARPQLRASTMLVEIDATLAGRAEAAAAGTPGVQVRQADAGDPSTFADVTPVDLLLLCGIFGNVTDDDIRTTVDATPALLAPNGTVIWTRGRFGDDDLRPAIRRWFVDAGLREVSFDGDPESFGVGVARAGDHPPPPRQPVDRLFTFTR